MAFGWSCKRLSFRFTHSFALARIIAFLVVQPRHVRHDQADAGFGFKGQARLRRRSSDNFKGHRGLRAEGLLLLCAILVQFVTHQIKYVYDPSGVETLQAPWVCITQGKGDCDCKVMLLATGFEAMGFPTRFVTIKSNPLQPKAFTHVYVEVQIPNRGWIGADATMPEYEFGWAPPKFYPSKRWAASHDSPEPRESDTMNGLGKLACATCPSLGGVQPDAHLAMRQGLSGMGCNGDMACEACASTLNGFSAMGESESEWLLARVLDGTEAKSLRAKRTAAQIASGDARTAQNIAATDGDGDFTALAQDAVDAARAALEDVNEQVAAYNDLQRQVEIGIRSLGLSTPIPPHLGVVQVIPALIGLGIVAAALATYLYWKGRSDTSLATAIDARTRLAVALKESGASGADVAKVIASAEANSSDTGIVQDTATLTKNVGMVAIIGGLVLIGFLALRKRGKV